MKVGLGNGANKYPNKPSCRRHSGADIVCVHFNVAFFLAEDGLDNNLGREQIPFGQGGYQYRSMSPFLGAPASQSAVMFPCTCLRVFSHDACKCALHSGSTHRPLHPLNTLPCANDGACSSYQPVQPAASALRSVLLGVAFL